VQRRKLIDEYGFSFCKYHTNIAGSTKEYQIIDLLTKCNSARVISIYRIFNQDALLPLNLLLKRRL
jgi:hypothetical protein